MLRRFDGKKALLMLVSLLFALFLFVTAKETAYYSSGAQINRLTETYTHTLENVPVELKYDSDKYFLSGYSYGVEVYLSSTNRIKLDSEINPDTRTFKVVADLTNLEEGTTKVTLKLDNLSSDVTADVRPDTMTVTLGKRASRTFPVEAVVDEEQIAPGYVLSDIQLGLAEVEVTSDETTLEQIARVEARLPAETLLTKSFQDQVSLQAVSENGTVLPGLMTPSKTDLMVKLKKLTKTVPLVVELVGDIDPSLSEIGYELGLSEVIISGSQENLDATDQVVVRVDVTDIKKDTRRTVTLSADNVAVTPEVVDVKLTVRKKTGN